MTDAGHQLGFTVLARHPDPNAAIPARSVGTTAPSEDLPDDIGLPLLEHEGLARPLGAHQSDEFREELDRPIGAALVKIEGRCHAVILDSLLPGRRPFYEAKR